MATTEKKPNPYDDALVAQLMNAPPISKFVRVQHLRAAAAFLEQAMTVMNPSQLQKLEELYKRTMDLAEDEAEMAPVRVILGEVTIWPDDADCYTAENAGPALRALLAGRTVGTRARIEHYDGDRYNVVEAYEVAADGVRLVRQHRAA